VGAERVLQAQTIAQMALSLKTTMVAHGCTAAGNDQVRFEVALRTLAPDLTIMAPVRDRAFKRPEQLKYLEDHRLPVPPFGAAYSVNRGTVGRHHRRQGDPDLRGQHSGERLGAVQRCILEAARARAAHASASTAGIRSSLDGEEGLMAAVAIIERLETLAGPSASGAAFIWATPSSAPRAASRSRRRRRSSADRASRAREIGADRQTGEDQGIRGAALRRPGARGTALDPVCRDIEALLVSSQARVSGEVTCCCARARLSSRA
jgi:argininosuccinate synthase